MSLESHCIPLIIVLAMWMTQYFRAGFEQQLAMLLSLLLLSILAIGAVRAQQTQRGHLMPPYVATGDTWLIVAHGLATALHTTAATRRMTLWRRRTARQT